MSNESPAAVLYDEPGNRVGVSTNPLQVTGYVRVDSVGGTGPFRVDNVGITGPVGPVGITGPVRVDAVGVTGPVRVDQVGLTGYAQVTGPIGVTGLVQIVGAVGGTGPFRVDSVGVTGPVRVDVVGITGPVGPVTVQGGGTPGVPTGGVVSVQGVTHGTPVPVSGQVGLSGPVRVDSVGVTGPVRVDSVGVTGYVQVTGPVGVTGLVSVVGAVGVTGPVRVDSVGVTGLVQMTGPIGVTGQVAVVGPVGITGPVSVDNHPTGMGVSGTVGVTGTVAVNNFPASQLIHQPTASLLRVQLGAGTENVGDVDVATIAGAADSGNSTTVLLSGGATFVGTAFDTLNYPSAVISVKSDVASASDGLKFQWSPDGTNWDVESGSDVMAGGGRGFHVSHRGRYFRVQYVNGASAQGAFRLSVLHRPSTVGLISRPLDDSIDGSNFAQVVKAVKAGTTFNASSTFLNEELAEHAVDSDNRLSPTLLTNGSATPFTADAGVDTLTSAAHGLVDGDPLNLTTTGTLPAPLTTTTTSSTGTTETIYWVINAATNTFQISTSPGGTAVNITDAGTGTHSFQKRGTYVGAFKDVSQVGSVLAFFFSNVKPAVARLEWSSDGVSQNTDLLNATGISISPIDAGPLGTVHVGLSVVNTMVSRYYRVRIVNGPAAQTLADYISFIGREAYNGSFAGIDSTLSLLSTALLVRSVVAGFTPNDTFKNVRSQGAHSGNSTATSLPGDMGGTDHIYVGEWVNWQEDYSGLVVDLSSDVPGTLLIEFSESITPVNGDDTDVLDSVTLPYDPAVTPLLRRHTTIQSKWVRVKYVNGSAAQSRFVLDSAFMAGAVLSPLVPMGEVYDTRHLATRVISTTQAERSEVANATVKVKTTRNDSDKDGLHVHVTGIEDHVAIRPLEAAQARQFTVGASAVQVDSPVLSTPGKRRVLGVQTRGVSWTAYGFSSGIEFTGNAMLLPPNSFKTIALDEGVNLWFITEQTGGTQTTQNLNGSSASGTATNPSNALTSNDVRASITAAGQTIRVTGVAYTPTANSTIQSVRVGCEARKQSGQESAVSHVATVTQASTDGPGNVGSITSSTVTGGSSRLILVAISRENENAAVNSVTNTGTALTWTKLQDVTAGSTRRLDVWWAYGNPGATFTVTANLSQTATNCHIAVSTYDGVDPSASISSSGTNTGTGTAVTGPSLTGANKQLSYLAVVQDNTTATAGTGYTERSDETTGTGAGADRDGLSTHTKALTTGGSEQGSATLSGSTTWGAIGVIVDNAPAADPAITLSYETPNGVAGSTTGVRTYPSETDGSQFLDITGDRSWTESNIDNIVIIATGQSIGAAACEVDRLWVEVVDTTGNTTRVSVEQYAGTS